MFLQLLLTFFLVFCNAFFVAAEFAIVKVRESQIELLVRTGNRIARTSKHIIEHLDTYLSATQLGITLASLGLGWIGEPVVSAFIIGVFNIFGVSIDPKLAHSIALPSAFILITILHIVFGELAPKSLAIQRPEQITLLVSLPLRLFYLVFSPFIWLLNKFANFLLKLAGFPPISETEQLHSSAEIRFILDESSKSGIIEVTDHKLINNIFEFADKDVKQVMVPRGKIVAIEKSMTFDEIVNKFISEGYSRMPVYDKNIDNITGMLNAKDIIMAQAAGSDRQVDSLIRKVYFIHEDELLKKVLNTMLRNKVHIAVVVDEFGGVAGLVTMEDIIEEIIGEIQDEYDDEKPLIEKLENNVFIISASAVISDINKLLPLPLPESEDYETLGGMIMGVAGKIPEVGEMVEFDGYMCEILQRSERTIEKVKLIRKQMEQVNE